MLNSDYFSRGPDRYAASDVTFDTTFEDELLAEIDNLREQNIHLKATLGMIRQVLGKTIDNLVIE
jgi:hypothetical protein